MYLRDVLLGHRPRGVWHNSRILAVTGGGEVSGSLKQLVGGDFAVRVQPCLLRLPSQQGLTGVLVKILLGNAVEGKGRNCAV